MNIIEPIVNSYKEYVDKTVYYIENPEKRKEIENQILKQK